MNTNTPLHIFHIHYPIKRMHTVLNSIMCPNTSSFELLLFTWDSPNTWKNASIKISKLFKNLLRLKVFNSYLCMFFSIKIGRLHKQPPPMCKARLRLHQSTFRCKLEAEGSRQSAVSSREQRMLNFHCRLLLTTAIVCNTNNWQCTCFVSASHPSRLYAAHVARKCCWFYSTHLSSQLVGRSVT